MIHFALRNVIYARMHKIYILVFRCKIHILQQNIYNDKHVCEILQHVVFKKVLAILICVIYVTILCNNLSS